MRCPNCQNLNPAGARFCNSCGFSLAEAKPLDGERRYVSILFADVVGSTSMAERVDPEVWTEIMNGAIQFMIDEVTRYEGTISRLMGDGLLALFGAPVSHEDDAERAVLAALGIRNAAEKYGAALRSRYGFEFSVRSGINTGLSVLTRVGDEIKAEYTAMGDAANLAARLQALAPPKGVLIGPETHELVHHRFATKARGEELIKGKTEPVNTFEVIGRLAGRDKSRSAQQSGATPFVGREVELETLRATVESGLKGTASIAFIVGEAGLGKSRLLSELEASHSSDARWVEGRAISYATNAPLHPWQELLTASLGLPDGADQAILRQRLTELHFGAGESSEPPPWFVLLALLLGLGDEAAWQATPATNAEEATRTMAQAVTNHLRRLAQERPLVLVLDDLHWADQATIGLLESLARTLTDERIVILCPLRPDRHAPSWSLLDQVENGSFKGAATRLTLIRLQPLSGGDAKSLISELLGLEMLPSTTSSTILTKAEGNPLFLEEVVHSLIDSGHITKSGEHWSFSDGIDAVNVPDTLAGVLSARIDRLQPRTRDVAQTAAVIGRYFPSRLLSAVMHEPAGGGPDPDIGPELETLTLEDLVNRTEPDSEIDYRFKHELTKDAAYERLLLRRRKELHGRVADELVALHGDREAEFAKDLAHHYRLGERWLEAARWSLTAARSAKVVYSLPDSLKLTESALEAIDRVRGGLVDDGHGRTQVGKTSGSDSAIDDSAIEKSDAARALEAQILSELVSLGILLRLHEDPERRGRQLELAQRAVDLSQELGDKRLLVTSLVNLGNIYVLSGFPVTGFDPLLEAHDLSLELGSDNLFLLPFWVATETLLDDAPLRAAEQFDEVIELARKVGNKDIEAHALGTKTAALARLGRFGEAMALSKEALAAADASGSVIKRADVALLVGASLLDMGRSDQGLEHIERGTELALSVSGMQCACSGLYLLGEGQMAGNRLPEAVGNLQQSLDYALDSGYKSFLHNVRASLAGARFLSGDTKAIEAIEQEIDNAEAFKDGYGAARARMTLAQALFSVGRPARAEGHARRAIKWFEERGMKPYAMRSYTILLDILIAQDDQAGAAEARLRVQELNHLIDWPEDDAVLPGGPQSDGGSAAAAGSE